jgi:SAM-dependent methyltransferase
MKLTSKFCDAADWFLPEMQHIIRNELREVPRFHRKQWEFAAIFLSLQQHGMLDKNKVGLSMGGGKELLLYAIAQHIEQLLVTDLYDTETTWDCAKTGDPDEFLKTNMPFPVDTGKFQALRMDMRDLKFPEKSFDFCYSSCAIEHIGSREDFLQHFNEVARVLKDDGVYVLTTEVHYGSETIPDPNNHVFSLEYLRNLFSDSHLVPEFEFDAHITQHEINYPVPGNIRHLSYAGKSSLSGLLFQEYPHIQLLRGKYPFTSGLFVLRKRGEEQNELNCKGLEATKKFIESGVQTYRTAIENHEISLNPFSNLPGESSRFYTDHEEFFTKNGSSSRDHETVFHTDYFWLGSGKRTFEVALSSSDPKGEADSLIEIRVHRFKTLASGDVDCASMLRLPVGRVGRILQKLDLEVDQEYCYAILAKVRQGSCMFDTVTIKSYPSRIVGSNIVEPPKESLKTKSNKGALWTLLHDVLPGSTPRAN